MPLAKSDSFRCSGLLPVLGMVLILTSCKETPSPKTGFDWDPNPAFWVWNQTTPPPPDHGHPQYLQVAEFTARSHRVLQSGTLRELQTAVVRLPPGRQTLADPTIQRRLFAYLKAHQFPRLQLDYDCASLNLELYREFLQSLRNELSPGHLSITALASWIDAPGFDDLAEVVDEITPMFYDLEPDRPAEILRFSCQALVDSHTSHWIRKWQTCPIPWRAGLPNYQRLSLFREDGTLAGHLPGWQPAYLRSLPGIRPLEPSHPDHLFLRIDQDQTYRDIHFPEGHLLLWRKPSESLTRKAIRTAQDAGARGLIWFAHPESTPVAWHSVPHLTRLHLDPPPQPKLETTFNLDGSVTLTNSGWGDLPSSPRSPVWQLILETSEMGTFASPKPGTFLSVHAPGASLVRPELARSIVLTFPQLRSGASLTSAPRVIHPTKQQSLTSRIHPAQ